MRKTVLAAACATALLGCKEHSKDTTVVPASKRDATAATNGSGVAESPIASKYKTCWASFNAAKWDELRACYAPGASIDPGTDGRQSLDVDAKLDAEKKARLAVPARHAEVELVIVADTTIIGVLQMTGGTSFYVVDVVEYDEHGRIKTEDIYRDGLGVSRPLPPGLVGGNAVVTGTGTEAEQHNQDVVDQFVNSLGRRAKPVEQWLSPDLVWSERWLASDLSRQTFVVFVNQLRAGIDGLESTGGTSWAAGDFVVQRAHDEGRPADMPWLGIAGDPHTHVSIPALTIFRLEQGHIKVAVEFWTIGALYAQLGISMPAKTPSAPTSEK